MVGGERLGSLELETVQFLITSTLTLVSVLDILKLYWNVKSKERLSLVLLCQSVTSLL